MTADAEPQPVRTVESKAVILNLDACTGMGIEHYMISRRLADGRLVRYVECCNKCGWVDETSLDWWAENAIKNAMPKRAQRIALAADSEPFAFVQSFGEELTLDEILVQALAASAHAGRGVKEKEAARGAAILNALRAEVARFQRLAEARALSVVRKRLLDEVLITGARVDKQEVLAAIR